MLITGVCLRQHSKAEQYTGEDVPSCLCPLSTRASGQLVSAEAELGTGHSQGVYARPVKLGGHPYVSSKTVGIVVNMRKSIPYMVAT